MNARGIWQAAYTAGVVLPKPLATCQYWHRSLNPKKLIDVGFSRLQVSRNSFQDFGSAMQHSSNSQAPGQLPESCQYWQRSLNSKKLIDVGFSRRQILHFVTPVLSSQKHQHICKC